MGKKDKLKDEIKELKQRIRHLETEGAWYEELADQERRTREGFQRLADALEISLSELYETPVRK
jgi:flagellar motility protein MotE (MotC chaperone)